jgi:hypothetical protein
MKLAAKPTYEQVVDNKKATGQEGTLRQGSTIAVSVPEKKRKEKENTRLQFQANPISEECSCGHPFPVAGSGSLCPGP